MSITTEATDFPESPNTRRCRSSSTASSSSISSPKSKQGGSKTQRKSSSLPGETVEYLKAWMMSPEHVAHPYPTEQEKVAIMGDTGIELKQLTNWFVNNRKRYWKPRVEARLQHQAVAVATSAITTSQLVIANRACEEIISLPQPAPQQKSAVSLNLDSTFATAPTIVNPTSLNVNTHFHDPCTTVEKLGTLATYIDSSAFPRAVSEASSSGSDCGNMSDSNSTTEESTGSDDSNQAFDTVCTETVDVHILRPICYIDNSDDKFPSIEDVSILPNVPAIRIIRSYRNILMMYHYSKDIADDRKKIQGKRDAEIVRIKKHHLKQYFSECSAADLLAMRSSPAKRKCISDFEGVVFRRRKFSEASPSLFREVCLTAAHVYDIGLPSLEEATALFGFAQLTNGVY